MNLSRFACIILVLTACQRSEQTSESKHLMENGLRRDATVDEAKSVVQLDGGCTAFFIKNEAGLPLLGTARHCFAGDGEIEGWCAAEGAFHDYAGNIGTCEKVIATDPRYDFVVFQAKY
ncbi:MAG: hypothetical protein M3Q07_15490, partial [Pseudobdellovibrionaceae bacterium]|nr:hypothetical protein [Pseudobdellovibrionaceae bacterium]